jgi:hypothetical protein
MIRRPLGGLALLLGSLLVSVRPSAGGMLYPDLVDQVVSLSYTTTDAWADISDPIAAGDYGHVVFFCRNTGNFEVQIQLTGAITLAHGLFVIVGTHATILAHDNAPINGQIGFLFYQIQAVSSAPGSPSTIECDLRFPHAWQIFF